MGNLISFWIAGFSVFVALVVVAVVTTALSADGRPFDLVEGEVRLLSERLASGEIDEDEFWTRMRSLGLT